ncbi:hypothetical protein BD626DRAFT_395225 [Schizophyllum amplum]|uniref:Uncharacterized protein n=1 Tax=Schizophyllum amplum TaxID=97359 RepID=A0A550CT66_9AGAR|nr:hypothetical protein BD626DRAFT_395225 [Auriculariopsis ampla]
MCYAYGSIDQATKTCPMCKVFPHGRGCPHSRDVCRNRANHPRCDVVYLKNAEVDTFNGCGYCKWAKTNPPAKSAGYSNQGWPGCCRPPTPSEYKLIPAADWKAVSIVHHIPIPTDVRMMLERAAPPMRTQSGSPTGRNPGSPSVPGKTMPQLDRRNSNPSPNPRPKWGSSTPPKTRSPQLPRSGSAERDRPSAGSPPGGKGVDLDPSSRKSGEHEGTVSRRQAATAKSSSSIPVSQVTFHSKGSTPPSSKTGSPPGSLASVSTRNGEPRSASKRGATSERRGTVTQSSAPQVSLATSLAALNISKTKSSSSHSSSASSISDASSSSGSMTDGTVTSDGGFTDYLSDDVSL